MKTTLIILLLSVSLASMSQTLSAQEMSLYNKMNDYRVSKGLTKLSLSDKLCKVAKLHAENVDKNKKKIDKYSAHSWFKDSRWKEDKYINDNDGKTENKPSEITGYSSAGYEIIYFTTAGAVSPDRALTAWQHSHGHNATILCKETFKGTVWTNCGVAIVNGVAAIWFGEGE